MSHRDLIAALQADRDDLVRDAHQAALDAICADYLTRRINATTTVEQDRAAAQVRDELNAWGAL